MENTRLLWTEDPKDHWEYIQPYGKVVLDLGCGRWTEGVSTAQYFKDRGASLVVAVDCLEDEIKWLAAASPEIKSSVCNLDSPAAIQRYLIDFYRPDIVKADIECAESHLFALDDAIFCIPEYYAIETHSPELLSECLIRLEQGGYQVEQLLECGPCPHIHVVFARKK
jgi:hypothetical protein